MNLPALRSACRREVIRRYRDGKGPPHLLARQVQREATLLALPHVETLADMKKLFQFHLETSR